MKITYFRTNKFLVFHTLFCSTIATTIGCCLISLILLMPYMGQSQIQNIYGTSFTNSFNKVIPAGLDFYVLGSESGFATVSRIDQFGNEIWTSSMFISSVWEDGIITANDDLIVVGSSLPANSLATSLIGEFTFNGSSCIKSLDESGLEGLNSIIDNFDGTYSAIGIHTTISTSQDVVVYNLSPNCLINSKKRYLSPVFDDFAKDILLLGNVNSDFLVAGRTSNHAIIYRMDAIGNFVGGAEGPLQYDFVDLANAGNDVLAVANPVGVGAPRIMRFSNLLLPKWEVSVNGLISLEQIMAAPNGDIYAVGTANVNGTIRAVVLKINDNGFQPSLAWSGAKYFANAETSYLGGHIAVVPAGGIAFVDGRVGNPNSQGGRDAYMALTDGDLTSDCTLEAMVSLSSENTLFDSPNEIELSFYDVPQDEIADNSNINWTQTEACSETELDISCGMAVATCFSGVTNPNQGPVTVIQNAPVIGLYDVRDAATSGISGDNWGPPKQIFAEGDATNCGQVFGIAIDNNGSILATASTIYGDASNTPGFQWGPGGPGAIYRFTYDNGKWVRQLYIDIPNFGSGLGNITYDKKHDQFFVTNHLDGGIYNIPNIAYPGIPAPLDYGFWFHSCPPTFPANVPGFCPLGTRTWGIGYNYSEDRVYFVVWNEDVGANRQSPNIFNEIKSVGLLSSGDIAPGSERSEILMPDYPTSQIVNPNINPTGWSNPVSDIEFSENGDMIVAEKTMRNDIGFAANPSPGGYAHFARIFQFKGSSMNWGAPQLIHIGNLELLPPLNGNPGTYNNSAGGVDYGYEDFTNNQLVGCDQLIWGSGDALMFPGYNDFNNSPNYLYGIAAMPASGNSATHGSISPDWVESHSIYVDLDGNLNSIEKLQIGDVDIYNCPCPAMPFPCDPDSIMVMYKPVTVSGINECCYSIGFKNLANNVTKICANLNTSGWIFNTSTFPTAGGFTYNNISTTQICVDFQNGNIPFGTFQDVLTICLAETISNPPPIQHILFEWYQGNNVVCEDIMMTDCVPPIDEDTCLIISNLITECLDNDLEYCMSFTVTNINNTGAFGLVLETLPPGYAYGDCGCGGSAYGNNSWQFSGFPLIGANSSINLCVKIIATSPVLSTTNVCFDASLELGNQCCSSPENWCVDLEPCCDPCENTLITVNEIDSCCYSIDLNYDCDFSYYTHVDFTILTSGVHFGWNANDPLWNDCIAPTSQYVCLKPFAGAIPSANYNDLFSFCLEDIDKPSEIPQQILVNFWTIGPNGQDSIACDTILTFNCEYKQDTCVFVTDEEIVCVPDSMKYKITLTVQNLSVPNFSASYLGIIGPGISPNPISLTPALNNDGSTRTVSFCYTPTSWPDADGKLELIYNLKNYAQDTCCNGNQTFIDTLLLPVCDTCSCPAPSIPGPNLVSNGNFSIPGSFISPVTSDYTFTSTNTTEGEYFVGDDPSAFNIGFDTCGDHTSGSGNMMIVNGNSISGEKVWCETISITPGAKYSFNCWIASLTSTSPADLQFSINGNLLGTGFQAPSSTCNWEKFCQLWESDTMTTAVICIENKTLTLQGNDFALDDISFERCSSTPVDTCCIDFDAFCQKIENAITITTDNDSCKAKLMFDSLDCNIYLEYIDWGDSNIDNGPIHPGDMAMHVYQGSGTYIISYLAIELDNDGLICFEKVVNDTIVLNCETCICPGGTTASPNLVFNGNFSLGDVGFLSLPTGGGPGQCICASDSYCVDDNLRKKCSSWPNVPDHTGDIPGNILILDGNSTQSATLWEQSVNIEPCMTYCFSFWTASVFPPNQQNFNLDIIVYDGNNVPVSTPFGTANILQTTPPWSNHSFTWSCPCNAVGPFTIAINQVVGSDFTDFGIDDICLTKTTPPDSCCTDFDAFCDRIENAVSITTNHDSCKAKLMFDSLDCNVYLEYIDWGDAHIDNGPILPGDMAMHVYQGSGTYIISYLAIELDNDGLICFEKVVNDTIIIDCTGCPCGLEDLQEFSDDVDKGFATISSPFSCGRCFSPISLSNCDSVEWLIDGIAPIPALLSQGNQTICYNFVTSGNYQITMVVTRYKPDGSICEVFTYSRFISVNCNNNPSDCTEIVFPNPGFGEGAIPGELNVGGVGNSDDWTAASGEPIVVEGASGSLDGWTIDLSTDIDKIDVLTTIEPICPENKIDTLSLRFGIKEKGIKSSIAIVFYRGDDFEVPNSSTWNPIRCLRLATIDLDPLEENVWYDLNIIYDISDWIELDTCSVRPAIYAPCCSLPVTSRTTVQIDGFCDKTIVAVNDISANRKISLFPNPTTGEVTVRFDDVLPSNGQIQVYDLLGRVVLTEHLSNGKQEHSFALESQPPGVYLVKIIQQGYSFWAKKIVKI